MSHDDQQLEELIEESQDLQSDALRDSRAALPDIREMGHERSSNPVDRDAIAHLSAQREEANSQAVSGSLAAKGLLATGFGAAIMAAIASPAAAQAAPVDVQALQTATSLELLAVATYKAALGLDFIANGNPVVKKFAKTTMMQHDEHGKAFTAQTTALKGKAQDQPNPKYLQVVNDAKPTLTDPAKVVDLAMSLETVATITYLNDLTLLTDTKSKEIFASIMGVESQHLATLRAVGALLAGGGADLIKLPPDAAMLPAAAGSVAFTPLPTDLLAKASPPEEGAVK